MKPKFRNLIYVFFIAIAILFTGLGLVGCKPEPEAEAEQVDENYIGTFAGIEVRVAPWVDREHGQAAFDILQIYDTTGDFTEGGRVLDVSGGVINKIIITGAPDDVFHVRHIGNGVLEARLNTTTTGGIPSIVVDGRYDIDHGIIVDPTPDPRISYIYDMKNNIIRIVKAVNDGIQHG